MSNKIAGSILNTKVNPSYNAELSSETGVVIDRKNFRLTNDENKWANVKLRDSLVEMVISSLSAADKEIGAKEINGHIFSVYSDNTTVYFAVDDTICLATTSIPYTTSTQLDILVNESGSYGDVFLNDRTSKPLVFNVNDMMDNLSTQKYFSEFEIEQYYPVVSFNISRIVFNGLKNNGVGCDVGTYSYSYRLISKDGDSTQWSIPSLSIPVPVNESTNPEDKSGILTYGGETGTQSKYAIRLKLRVVNNLGFEYIELKRIKYTNGLPELTDPVYESKKLLYDEDGNSINIGTEKHIILHVLDDNVGWEPLSESDIDISLVDIEKVQAQRYFNNILWYAGVDYASRDISDLPDAGLFIPETLYNNLAYPIKKNIGEKGYADIYNQVNYKSLMSGERYGWAIICYDGIGAKTFALPYSDGGEGTILSGGTTPATDIHDLTNYKMPERRETINPSFANVDPFYAASNSKDCGDLQDNVSRTHEVFGNATTEKNDNFVQINIKNIDDNPYAPLTPTSKNKAYATNNESASDGSIGTGLSNLQTYVTNNKSVVGAKSKINTHIIDYGGLTSYSPLSEDFPIYATGMAFNGVDTSKFPSWVKGFSIARTRRAGRVVAQGIGMYSLIDGADKLNKKETNKLWFYSPDINSEIGVSPQLFDDIIDNPSNYRVQLVSPVGFFSEAYYGYQGGCVDMLVHAKIAYENNRYNSTGSSSSTDYAADINGDGYVRFGKWRNSLSPYIPADHTFDLTNAVQVKLSGNKNERSEYLELTLNKDIYLIKGTNETGFKSSGVKGFHEPFYIINIIQEKNIPKLNTTNYNEEVVYIKLKSLIGYGDGVTTDFDLVDERIEDAEDGVYVDGVLWTTISIDGNTVKFTTPPPDGAEIEVWYNNQKPIHCFGGDTFINDSMFSPIDVKNDKNGSPASDFFRLDILFPYLGFHINDKIKLPYSWNAYTSGNDVWLTYIRQMAVSFFCESRVNLSLLHTSYFPNPNYIYRPYKWKDNLFSDSDPTKVYWSGSFNDSNGIHPAYYDDYGKEFLNWGYGGFKIDGGRNNDYNRQSDYNLALSKPIVGYQENTNFPNRIIWSMKREDNVIYDPGIKTFISSNKYDVKNDNGSLHQLWDLGTDKGNNLYVFANKGVCVLLINQNLIRSSQGDFVALATENNRIGGEVWISDEHGIPSGYELALASYEDTMFFVNNKSVFLVAGNKVIDIKDTYEYYVNEEICKEGFDSIQSVFDIKHKELLINVERSSSKVQHVFIFDDKHGGWAGRYDYDGLLVQKGNDIMSIITKSGSATISKLDAASTYKDANLIYIVNDNVLFDKDYEGLRINSNVAPTQVSFSRTYNPATGFVSESDITTFKKYSGWFNKIGLSNGQRMHSRYLYVNVQSTDDNPFSFISSSLDYRLVRIK